MYSKSEVTVIDTSCEVWKFDKLVFRKKNVWKVRDKKGRTWTGGSKKRTKNDLPLCFGDPNANALVSNKKAKLGASKDVENGGYSSLSINVQKLHENVEICKERPDDLGQVAKKRSPRKIRKSGSSSILIKDISTGKKSSRKDSQRQ
uniref:Uncharacterized protein MANES_01G043100 n=1 Tax=Rhizophora mucronata TaxID=61149 RepID=A0A2P2QEF7_RHIMU